jgi:hypothetical protein
MPTTRPGEEHEPLLRDEQRPRSDRRVGVIFERHDRQPEGGHNHDDRAPAGQQDPGDQGPRPLEQEEQPDAHGREDAEREEREAEGAERLLVARDRDAVQHPEQHQRRERRHGKGAGDQTGHPTDPPAPSPHAPQC